MQQQITAAALYGTGGGTPGMAVSPYGVGLGIGAAPGAVVATPPAALPAGTFLGFEGAGVTFARDFWSSAGFGLILLILLVAYFDIRLLNR